MKIQNPIYLAFALGLTLFAAMANHQGWSALQAIASRSWQHSEPGTQHK